MSTVEQRAARAAYMRVWRIENHERWREIANKANQKWVRENPDHLREIKRAHRYAVRREILTLIGGALRCQCCGYDNDWRALQIDHIHGGGRRDPETANRRGNTNLWAMRNKLMRTEYLKSARLKYQVLCANCNSIKRHLRGEHSMTSNPLRAVAASGKNKEAGGLASLFPVG